LEALHSHPDFQVAILTEKDLVESVVEYRQKNKIINIGYVHISTNYHHEPKLSNLNTYEFLITPIQSWY
jgi:hypothetical protein